MRDILKPFLDSREETPFPSVGAVMMWTIRMLELRREGRPETDGHNRPCYPDDITRIIDRLYRQRQIDLAHARALRIWGEKGRYPVAEHPSEAAEARLWRELADRLEPHLRAKGIVV